MTFLNNTIGLISSLALEVGSFIESFIAWVDENVPLEALISVPALFVAFLIPIVIFIMERDDLYGFDKNVILDKILLYKKTFPLLVIVSVTLLLPIKTVSLIFDLVAFVLMCVVLTKTYKWMSAYEKTTYKLTYKQSMRIDFLKSLKTNESKIDTWALVLNDKDLSEKNQRGLIEVYIKTALELQDNNSASPKSNMLALMSRNVEKIDFSDSESYQKLVGFALDYYKQRYEVGIKRQNATNANEKSKYRYPSFQQRVLVMQLMQIGMNRKSVGDILSYVFFSQVKDFVNQPDVNEPSFIREFFPGYITILEDNPEYEIEELWHELDSWTITEESLKGDDSAEKSVALINSYMRSVAQKARPSIELPRRFINIVDIVTEKILPGINMILWFDVITFYNSGWGLDEGEDSTHGQIRAYLGKDRNFGLYTSFGETSWVDDESVRRENLAKAARKQDNETIYILGIIYPWLRNPNEIQKVIEQINIIRKEKLFPEDSMEFSRLTRLEVNFQKISLYIKELDKI